MKKMYGSVVYHRPSGRRMISEVSHSIKALRRRGAARVFEVAIKEAPASQFGLREYTVGRKGNRTVKARLFQWLLAFSGERDMPPFDRADMVGGLVLVLILLAVSLVATGN